MDTSGDFNQKTRIIVVLARDMQRFLDYIGEIAVDDSIITRRMNTVVIGKDRYIYARDVQRILGLNIDQVVKYEDWDSNKAYDEMFMYELKVRSSR